MPRAKIKDRAGDYDQRITIQQLKSGATKNDYGEIDTTDADNWETYATRWAAIEPVGSKEQLRGGQVTPIAQYRIRLRSDSQTRAVTSAMRILWDSRELNVESILDQHAQKRQIEITAKESQ